MKVFQTANPVDLDSLVTRLWELDTTGIVEQGTFVMAYFSDAANLSGLVESYGGVVSTMADQPAPLPLLPAIEDQEPILAGEQFAIASSLSRATWPAGRTCIRIDAENAFGSGRHESTQLVIAALETYLHRDAVLLDVGSGSGVLSAVASHLGARVVVACDTHIESVYLTRRHQPEACVFVGSVDSLRHESFDVVVANISARVIDRLCADLNGLTKADGWLILAGFVSEQLPKHFTPTAELSMNDWKCWICKPRSVSEEEKRGASSLQPFASEWW